MLPQPKKHLLPAIGIVTLLLVAPVPVYAQRLGLDLDLGDVGVGVGVGGGRGLDLDVDVGDDLGVGLGVGGRNGDSSGGLDLDVDLGLDTGAGGDPLDAVPGAATSTLSQESALRAVRSGRALPLDEIMLRAALITDGEIIDAQLIAVRDVLLYELKVLGKAGKVSDLYFYARSGLPVE